MATIDLGKIKFNWRNEYNNSTPYVPDDCVYYTDGSVVSSYICKTASTGNAHKHIGTMQYYGGQYPYGKMLDLPVPMRTIPTGSFTGDIRAWTASGSNNGSFTTINFDRNDNKFLASNGSTTNANSGGSGNATPITLYPNSSMSADAEL